MKIRIQGFINSNFQAFWTALIHVYISHLQPNLSRKEFHFSFLVRQWSRLMLNRGYTDSIWVCFFTKCPRTLNFTHVFLLFFPNCKTALGKSCGCQVFRVRGSGFINKKEWTPSSPRKHYEMVWTCTARLWVSKKTDVVGVYNIWAVVLTKREHQLETLLLDFCSFSFRYLTFKEEFIRGP